MFKVNIKSFAKKIIFSDELNFKTMTLEIYYYEVRRVSWLPHKVN